MTRHSPDPPADFAAPARPPAAWTRHTCSWCGEIGPAGRCGGCGHRNDLPRLACDCRACRADSRGDADLAAAVTARCALLGLSPVERAAFDAVTQLADRTLSRLRAGERRQVLAHLGRAFAGMTA